MFWSAEIQNEKPFEEPAEKSYHISNAALDINSFENDSDNCTFTQIWVQVQSKRTLLATLSEEVLQVQLDLAFESGEQATYFTQGPGTIHLSGYIVPSEVDDKRVEEEEGSGEQREETVEEDAQVDVNESKITLEKNVVIEDLMEGNGKKAKIGDLVTIYFENKLDCGTIVGQIKKGDGFKFELGSADVIAAWNIGMIGMKTGSVRNITCPADLAYGPEGVAGLIPGNSSIISQIKVIKIQRSAK